MFCEAKYGQIFSKLFVLLLYLVLVLGGCGKEGQKDGSAQASDGKGAVSDTEERMAYKDIRYLPEFTDISDSCNAFGSRGLGFGNDTFYLMKKEVSGADYGVNISGGQLVAYSPGAGEERVLLDQADMEAGMVTAAPLDDGSVIVLLKNYSNGYGLCRVDAEGTEIFSGEIPISGELLNCRFAADDLGRSYLLCNGEILLFDEKGGISGKVDVSGKTIGNIVCSGSGTVYIHELYTNQLIPIDFETTSLGTTSYTVPIHGMLAIAAAGQGDFLICDAATVYRYQVAEASVTPLFDLQDSQIRSAADIDTMGELEDGKIFLFTRDGDRGQAETALLTPTPLAECPVREEVTLGLAYPYSEVLESVADFNRRSEEFSVRVMNYGVGGRSFSEAGEAMRLDYSIGKGPDLCVVRGVQDPEALFAAGCFADLWEYLDKSEEYKRESFISQALDIYTWKGQLMAIPQYFCLETLVGKSDLVGETMGWDVEDMKALIDSHPDALIFDTRPSSYMLTVCARNMLDKFVDFEEKKADFDSREYIEFLNFLKELPNHFSEKEESECWTYRNEWLREGRALLSFREIYGFNDLQLFEHIFDGSYTCIGYPSSDKAPDCIIKENVSYAVSALSPHKDLAWKFVEWNLSRQGEDGLDSIVRGGFPSRIDVFERELQDAVGETGALQEDRGGFFWNGALVKYRETTSREAELIDFLIESAAPERSGEQTILDIMGEEAAYLYDGSKTAEEVAKVTQNRVQLYLNE